MCSILVTSIGLMLYECYRNQNHSGYKVIYSLSTECYFKPEIQKSSYSRIMGLAWEWEGMLYYPALIVLIVQVVIRQSQHFSWKYIRVCWCQQEPALFTVHACVFPCLHERCRNENEGKKNSLTEMRFWISTYPCVHEYVGKDEEM